MRRVFQQSTKRCSEVILPLWRAQHGTSPPAAPPPPPSPEELDRLINALERDDALLEGVVANMQAHHRRRLVVAGGAMEWFGKDSVAKEVELADADKDRLISPKDFDNWFSSALKRKSEEASKQQPSNTTATTAQAKAASAASEAKVPLAALAIIALEAGLPFVGFGFLDNATMILAGDAIDHSVGFYLHCSVMASAAMGNVVSGVMGMQVHGLVEKAVEKLNLKTPVLTEEQRRGRRVFLAGHLGGTIGIMTGLTLGMLPLLLISSDEDAQAFKKWDVNSNGFLDVPEILLGVKEVGIQISEESVRELISHYSADGRLTLEQFRKLTADLRSHAHPKHTTTAATTA